MRVPDKQIRIGLMSALASLSYAGQPVGVSADMNTPDATYPRVTIKSITTLQEGSKSQFMYETDVTLLVEDRKLNIVNSNIVDDIADAIAQLLVPSLQGEYFAMTDFRVWFVDVNSTVTNTYTVTPHQYTDKNIRITIKSEQK